MAEACSVTSKSSRTYRRVARTSHVDESLFGSAAKGKPGSLKLRKHTFLDRRVGKQGVDTSGSEVVTVSKSQLKRMMEPSPILTAAQLQALQQQAQEAKEKERAHSNARKARMLAMEEARKNKVGRQNPMTVFCGLWDICQQVEIYAVPTHRNRSTEAASGP